MVNTQHIGAYIKALRWAAKLSQHALATECGVSRVAVTKWESGDTKNLKLTNLIALQRIFDISFDCLLLATLYRANSAASMTTRLRIGKTVKGRSSHTISGGGSFPRRPFRKRSISWRG